MSIQVNYIVKMKKILTMEKKMKRYVGAGNPCLQAGTASDVEPIVQDAIVHLLPTRNAVVVV
jgi:hypothetical protein